jgi:hypothetical protein
MKPHLQTLATDDTARAEIVEHLRCASEILDGSAIARWGADAASKVAAQVAPLLLAHAQGLCDHARVSPDGRCRYCRAEMPDEA